MKKCRSYLASLKRAITIQIENRQLIDHWESRGKPYPPPGLVKQENLRNIAKGRAEIFIETGSLVGDTLFALKGEFKKLYSIELDPFLFSVVKRRFADAPHVEIIQGDSAVEIPKLVPQIEEPAIFWLDGHYSGEGTGRAEKDTPISEEIECVLSHPYQHVMVIDDLRLFGSGDYPEQRVIEDRILKKRPGSTIYSKDDALFVVLK